MRRVVRGLALIAASCLSPRAGVGAADATLGARIDRRRLSTLRTVAGEGAVGEGPLVTAAEDFARYEERVPGMFFFLGVAPRGVPDGKVAPPAVP